MPPETQRETDINVYHWHYYLTITGLQVWTCFDPIRFPYLLFLATSPHSLIPGFYHLSIMEANGLRLANVCCQANKINASDIIDHTTIFKEHLLRVGLISMFPCSYTPTCPNIESIPHPHCHVYGFKATPTIPHMDHIYMYGFDFTPTIPYMDSMPAPHLHTWTQWHPHVYI